MSRFKSPASRSPLMARLTFTLSMLDFSTISPADAGRPSGVSARQDMITDSQVSGSSGRKSRGRAGGSLTRLTSNCIGFSDS